MSQFVVFHCKAYWLARWFLSRRGFRNNATSTRILLLGKYSVSINQQDFNSLFRLYAVALSIAYDFLSDFDDGSTEELNILMAKYLGILNSQLNLIKTKILVKLQFETYISQEQYDRKVKLLSKQVKKLE